MKTLGIRGPWILLLLGSGLLLWGWALPLPGVQAAPGAQGLTPFPTPTPGPDGRILYTVQPGDTLWRVAAISGLTVEELRELNNLAPEETIRPGETLLLGIAGPAISTPTPGPTATPTPLLPTPTAEPGKGEVCVLLYQDRNGNGIREEDLEPLLAGGVVSLNNRSGSVSLTEETQEEPICFNEVPEGEYNLTMAVPSGYNPTTALNVALTLQAGDTMYVSFGAQPSDAQAAEAGAATAGPSRSPLLGIVGAALILAGAGLWFYARRLTA